VLSAAYPQKAPHFFAYMRTIVRASRNFEGTAWVSYDMSYRRAAANKCSLDWGLPDPGRFNDAFVEGKGYPKVHILRTCWIPTRQMTAWMHLHRSSQNLQLEPSTSWHPCQLAHLSRPVGDRHWLKFAIPSTTPQAPGVVFPTVVLPTYARNATAHTHIQSAGIVVPLDPGPHWGHEGGSRSRSARTLKRKC